MSPSAENDAPDPLATLITNYLRCYTLPANYSAPLYGQTHDDVATNCGPIIAEVVREQHTADYDALREAVTVGLRKCRVEDGSPVSLIRDCDIFHISHMVAREVARVIPPVETEEEQ